MIVICDKCGEEIDLDKGRYTIADVYDEGGRLIQSRHPGCQPDPAEARRRFAEAHGKATELLNQLQKRLR